MNLNQVTIPVSNLANSISFYTALGLKLIVHSPAEYARLECSSRGSTFSLHRVDRLPSGDGAWIYFEIEALDQFVENLVAQGIEIEELPTDKPWLWREARLKEPDQNQLILYFAGENRLNPPWRLEDSI